MHALRQYGKEYIALEEAAHQAHKGMWQGSFEMPADWRKDQKIDKLLAQRGESLQPRFAFTNISLHSGDSVLCKIVQL